MEKNNNEKEDRVVFSLFTGLLRISFSMFFINLYVARFEFFARKSLIANEALTNVSIFSIVNIQCLCDTFFTHVLLIALNDTRFKEPFQRR